ncbi:DUF1778 domain-containing protein [Bifidobacterium pullorum subsp. saeculare]|uniref:DUF1778 domain-containing protein n=1 Tax=Bifidobacterium pullorum subsp. saeculare TaxID=78257 RepID=A0A939BAK2_9BIFI|nr:DUF1778 domain-containing protein [Bifidobacterium pullorum]MBM6700445.1 DUF1778 domain-containing protein [Bifidobacterium pullorum subsp. saeculare]
MAATAAPGRVSRLDVRMTEEQRGLINRAAALKGATITQWALDHLMDDARKDIEDETSIRLSTEAFDAFLKALDEPMPKAAVELLGREPNWL